MRSYAVEIKGIAMPGMLKDNLQGRLWIGKLQPGQLGSILGNLLNEALFNRNCHSSLLLLLVRKPDIVNYVDPAGYIMKKRKDLAVFARRQPS
jgi:hypothetical protein